MRAVDRSYQANDLLAQARASWPRWRNSALKPAPRWFRGQELDVLEPCERDRLYHSISGGLKRASWVLPIIAVSNLANMIRGLRSEQDRWPWIAFATLLMALMIAAPLLRRRNILQTARRTLRESSEWPLTRLNRFGGADSRP